MKAYKPKWQCGTGADPYYDGRSCYLSLDPQKWPEDYNKICTCAREWQKFHGTKANYGYVVK